MKTNVILKRQASGCTICGNQGAQVGRGGRWSAHKPGSGYNDGVRYGNKAAQKNCPASGLTPAQVDDWLRTFESWSNPHDRITDGSYHRQTVIHDEGDSISLRNELRLGVNLPDVVVDVRVAPHDTPRLISELTRIAVARDLLPVEAPRKTVFVIQTGHDGALHGIATTQEKAQEMLSRVDAPTTITEIGMDC